MTELRPLGGTGIEVTRLCAGAAAWRDEDHPWGSVGEDETAPLARALLGSDRVRYLDTANNYGDGESERRIGAAIRAAGGLPPGFVLQTKADRDTATGDFSGARMRRSLEESMERLGLDHLPIVFLHDPENTTWEEAMAADGPVAALVQARHEGTIGHLGISGGPTDLLERFVESGQFELLITHNRHTLVDRSADHLLTLASERGLGVLNAAPYGGGMLTRWPVEPGRYAYGDGAPALVAAANEIGRICADAGIPLAAAALQFSTRDPRITSTIVGMRTVGDLEASIELDEIEIPDEVWDAVRAVSLDASTWQDPVDA
ncbi:oxidoreductase [Luteimicrobium album]|uniref:Oxidoreductase n=1 Tax=Luteimicrobium album TaxID=1054550 RepID=A0ABQ6HZS6_9MICO|nr:aldo/keto reductase [Luteimicrobium album]GMA23492.1 oxidoreductase [Luteimicrobium album]